MKLSFLQLVRYLYRQRRGLFTLLVLLSILVSLFEMAGLASVYLLVSSTLTIMTPEPASRILLLLQNVVRSLPIAHLFVASVALFVSIESGLFLLNYVQGVLVQYSSLKLRQDFHLQVFDKYMDSDYQYFLDRRQGNIMYRIMSAPPLMGGIFVALPQMIAQSLKTLAIFALLFSVSAPVTLALIVLGGVFFVGSGLLGKLLAYDWGQAKVRSREKQNVLVNEALGGIKQIKVYGHLDRWTEAFWGACNDFAVMLRKLFAMSTLPGRALTVVSMATLVIAAIVLKNNLGDRFPSYLPLIAMYFFAMQRVFPAVAGLAQARLTIVENVPLAQVVYDELHTPSKFLADGTLGLESIGDGIRFDKVSLSYPGKGDILRDVSILCKKGESTAIVGPSGAGKSSLLNLIVRLYDPTKGVISVGGVNLAELNTKAWRRRIGFVAQESFLFYASAADNIAFGRDTTRAEIEEAARLADADEFIRALPEGYDTLVGEQGLKLSGGQRQRIGIVRAILTQPEILIFDEATNWLDARSEAAVQSTINRVSEGRTVIIVAHRLSTIENADHIVVIDKGRVVEEGTHADLLRAQGLYYALYNRQQAGEHEPESTPAFIA